MTKVSLADKTQRLYKRAKTASQEFALKASEGRTYKFKIDTLKMDPKGNTLKLEMNSTFSDLPFRPDNVHQLYADYKQLLGRKFKKSNLSIWSVGKEISELIPNFYRDKTVPVDASRLAVPKNKPATIVRNVTKNVQFPNGLDNRNIALWQSHG